MGDNRTSQEKLESAETIREWAKLISEQAYTYTMIAEEYGCSVQNVSQRMKAYISALPKQDVEEVVESRLDNLRYMRRKLQDGIEAGNTRSIEMAIRIDERIAKLTGTDKPEKVEQTIEVIDNTPQNIKDMLARRKAKQAEDE